MTSIYIKEGTVLPERAKNDLYKTEKTLIRAAIRQYAQFTHYTESILDPGAGDGRWGQIAGGMLGSKVVVGVELEYQEMPLGFTDWYSGQDYIAWQTDYRFDLIAGNPPYFLAEEFIRKSWDLLAPGGQMMFLLRLAFQEGVARYNGLWSEIYPYEVAVCSRRPSFYGGGSNGTAFGLFMWKKNQSGSPVGNPRFWRTSLLLHDRDKDNR
jgi:hypothetical protein